MPYDPARAEDEIARALYDYAFKSNESHLILFHTSPRSFEKMRVETMATAATSFLECANFDRWFLRGEDRPIPSTYGPYFRSASLSVGMAPNSTCEEPWNYHPDVCVCNCSCYQWLLMRLTTRFSNLQHYAEELLASIQYTVHLLLVFHSHT